MPPCLTESDLEQLHAGALPTQQAEQFRAHLAACESCRRRDAAFLAEHNALVADLHQARDDDALGPAETLPVPPVDVELPSPAAARGSSNQPVIEGYEIVRELHRGGQGVVYQAVQASTKRKVAIKVLLEGPYASASARRRFEREIELAASLKHPNIVAIFHSGRTPDGRQFCVMDYIRGVPLNQYVRNQKLPLEKALSLFTGVCEAVNYAHQKGVIHRDLKPSNILVDSAGVPRVLDFGLAKQVGGPEQTLVSMTGQVVGTLPYMSPEQARGNPDEIDIRTDVYSLGVLLYEMLTGHYPYPVVGQMADVLRHIADTPPTPPSRSWKPQSGILERTTKRIRAGTCPIDDEVQTIVLRALTKERDRRYQSAADLGNDIGHYLKNEPIEAKRDSALYVFRKQLRRYKTQAFVSAGFVLTLAIFAGVMSYQAARERDLAKSERIAKTQAIAAATQAVAARNEAEQARRLADQERARADAERKRAEQQSEALRGRDYVNRIALAANADGARNSARVMELLRDCPKDLRGWEWHRLRATADNRLWSLGDQSQYADQFGSRAAFSPDGTRIASVGKDRRVHIFDALTGRELLTLSDPNAPANSRIHCLAYSADGRWLATGTTSGAIVLWDASSGAERARLDVKTRKRLGRSGASIYAIAFSSDGNRLVSANYDGRIQTWDVGTGKPLLSMISPQRPINFVAFNSDETRIFSAEYGDHRPPRMWDARSGKEICLIDESWTIKAIGPPSKFDRVFAVSPESSRVLDANSLETLASFSEHYPDVRSVAFSPDSKRIVLTLETEFRCYDIETRNRCWSFSRRRDKSGYAKYSPDGALIVTSDLDVLFAASGKPLVALRGSDDPVTLSWSLDGARLLSLDFDGRLSVWNAHATGPSLQMSLPEYSGVSLLTFSRDGSSILACGSRARPFLKVWDASTGEETKTLAIQPSSRDPFTAATTISIDGRRLIYSLRDGSIQAMDTASGRCLWRVEGTGDRNAFESDVDWLALSNDGTRLAVAPGDPGKIRLFDAESGKLIRSFGPVLGFLGKGYCGPIAFSHDGTILSASSLSSTYLLDVQSGKRLATLKPPPVGDASDGGRSSDLFDRDARLRGCTQFSPDDERILGFAEDRSLHIWEVSTGSHLLSLGAHNSPFLCSAFSPDGRRIEAGCDDGTTVMWDGQTGEKVYEMRGHTGRVAALAFSPDGARLVSADSDSTVRVWDTEQPSPDVSEARYRVAAASRAVTMLFEQLGICDDVIRNLSSDRFNDESLRQTAIRIARARGDDAALLYRFVEKSLNKIDGDSTEYHNALRMAETACKLAPENVYSQIQLGIAQYRVCQFQQALQTLDASELLINRRLAAYDDHWIDTPIMAFRAMSLHRLGQHNEARKTLAKLRRIVMTLRGPGRATANQYLKEAESVIGGTPASSTNGANTASDRAVTSRPSASTAPSSQHRMRN